MKGIIYFLLLALFFTGCSPRIVRTGYQAQPPATEPCELIIKKNFAVSNTLATKVGEIKIGDKGLSVSCTEAHALEILKGEACSLNADLIVITEEKRPGFRSSCYRGRTEFYKFSPGEEVETVAMDEAYSPEKVKERVSRDRRRNKTIMAGSVTLGVITGLLIIQ